jgi:hypothetical protein
MSQAELFHGLFQWHAGQDGQHTLSRPDRRPATVPCPATGRALRIATLEAAAAAICPSCAARGRGGFVTFEGDLRMAYACPQCRQFVWIAGL